MGISINLNMLLIEIQLMEKMCWLEKYNQCMPVLT
jgi:hypothetical protein